MRLDFGEVLRRWWQTSDCARRDACQRGRKYMGCLTSVRSSKKLKNWSTAQGSKVGSLFPQNVPTILCSVQFFHFM